jgi:hypothetical protein
MSDAKVDNINSQAIKEDKVLEGAPLENGRQ